MDKLTIYDIEQGSEAWHDLRCGRFTASKYGALMAGKSTTTYIGLINDTVGQILSGEAEEGYTNEDMQRGIDLEPDAASFYSEIKDVELEEVGFITNESIHPEYVGVSPDRMIGKNLLEIKCPKAKTHIGYLRAKKLPTVYKWQVQGQLLVTGADWCDFMSYYPNIDPFIIRVYPDKDMQKELIERINESVEEVKQILIILNN